LAASLDAFLGGRASSSYEASRRTGWFETRLFAISDPRLPLLNVGPEEGVPLLIAESPEASHDDAHASVEGVALRFDPWATSVERETTGFDSRTLLSLLADPTHRKINLLRDVGSRLKLASAIPPDLDRLPLPVMDRGELTSYAGWVLDILNLPVNEPAVVDVLVHYVGGFERLHLHLLRVLFSTMHTRAPIALVDVERAWKSPAFRDAARLELLTPLESEPAARAVLGAALFVGGHPGAEVAVADVALALDEFWDADLDDSRVVAALAGLEGKRLIEGGERWRIPNSGVGAMLFDWLRDLDGYIRAAVQAL
jgi:hypothetical protein